jgi:hypothetical protein
MRRTLIGMYPVDLVPAEPSPAPRNTARTVSLVVLFGLMLVTAAVVAFVVLVAPAASAAGGCGG